jgi:anti-sigma factor RsiW
MNTATQLRVQAYLDNELSPGEARKLAQVISTDPEARALYEELKQTHDVLSANEPPVTFPESREFYWSKIERGIQAAERLPIPTSRRSWWLRLVAPMAGAVALFAILLSVMTPGERPAHILTEVEELAPDVSTITFRSEAEGVTVVWVSTK